MAGKNPVTHVGKLYNIAANLIAQRLVDDVPGLDEAQCLIVSQIGFPLDQPQAVDVSVRGSSSWSMSKREIAVIIADELARLSPLPKRPAEPLRSDVGRCDKRNRRLSVTRSYDKSFYVI